MSTATWTDLHRFIVVELAGGPGQNFFGRQARLANERQTVLGSAMPTPPLVLASLAVAIFAFACRPEPSEPAEGGGGDPPSSCAPADCGPKPGMPNSVCDDGVTVAGPGECKLLEGACGWEIVECPPSEPGKLCGGIAGIQCPAGQACVDDPNDSCDPEAGGADCSGLCQAG